MNNSFYLIMALKQRSKNCYQKHSLVFILHLTTFNFRNKAALVGQVVYTIFFNISFVVAGGGFSHKFHKDSYYKSCVVTNKQDCFIIIVLI